MATQVSILQDILPTHSRPTSSKDVSEDSTYAPQEELVRLRRGSTFHRKLVAVNDVRSLARHYLVDIQILREVGSSLDVRISPPTISIPLHRYLFPEDSHRIFERKFCFQLSAALDFLHSTGIVHGAVKGENVLVDVGNTQEPRCVLGKFADERTPSTDVLVTYANWMPPELSDSQAFAARRLDTHYEDDYKGEYRKQSDVYALACTAIEIYTTKPPAPRVLNFDRKIDNEERKKAFIAETHNLRPSGIPDRIWQVISQMLHPDPGLRINATNAKDWFRCTEIARVVRSLSLREAKHEVSLICQCEGKGWH